MSANGSALGVGLDVNARSRRGRALAARTAGELAADGVALSETHLVRGARRIHAIVATDVDRGARLALVGGRDGTRSAAAGEMVGTDAVLGVITLGPGNQFARDRGILSHAPSSAAGLTGPIADEFSIGWKRALGRLAYMIAVARALPRTRPFRACLGTAEGEQCFEALQVVIGKGRFHAGPFPLAPDASITDGRLAVYMLACRSRWQLLRYALSLPGGHHVGLPYVHAVTIDAGRLETEPRERITVDGEVILRTPIDFGVRPRALRARVPAGSA
ncbi:MAG: hypothetical protein IT208_15975 [Chthonomonadales bacterium]|nr:hypothetical protein [Chthonomonadales bacterium]